jgi:hypothetical protein
VTNFLTVILHCILSGFLELVHLLLWPALRLLDMVMFVGKLQ